MVRRILVPLDFSKPSLQALDYAIEFGRPFKPEFVVLHVLEPISYTVPGDMFGAGDDTGMVYRELEHAWRAQLAHVAVKLRKKHLTARTLLRVSTAYHVIVETAKQLKADLIVLSTHGRTGLSHVLMGSIAERVVRAAVHRQNSIRALDDLSPFTAVTKNVNFSRHRQASSAQIPQIGSWRGAVEFRDPHPE